MGKVQIIQIKTAMSTIAQTHLMLLLIVWLLSTLSVSQSSYKTVFIFIISFSVVDTESNTKELTKKYVFITNWVLHRYFENINKAM